MKRVAKERVTKSRAAGNRLRKSSSGFSFLLNRLGTIQFSRAKRTRRIDGEFCYSAYGQPVLSGPLFSHPFLSDPLPG